MTHLVCIQVWKELFMGMNEMFFRVSLLVVCVVVALIYNMFIEKFWGIFTEKIKHFFIKA